MTFREWLALGKACLFTYINQEKKWREKWAKLRQIC